METSDVFEHGLLRITAASSVVAVGNPIACARHCIERIAAAPSAQIVLLPELALGGYTCGDLFTTSSLLDAVATGVQMICEANRGTGQFVVVGAPLVVDGSLMNTAVVIADGRVLGIVPKQYLPTYREFYEGRHFRAGDGSEAPFLDWLGQRDIPLGIDLLFRWRDALIGIEICEDLWCPVPPSSLMALAGANVLLNLSASNETIGKAAWRRELVLSQSGRCIAAYAYASSGPTESTTDLVFGGHCLIAENGVLLGQSRHVGDGEQPDIFGTTAVTAEIDLQKLMHDRRLTSSFDDGRPLGVRKYRHVNVPLQPVTESAAKPLQPINGRPFVPQAPGTLDRRCAEILSLQAAGLAKRLSRLSDRSPLVIGVSGGLDSTLALLVAIRTCDVGGWPRSRILGLTLPGFGTTEATHDNAQELMRLLGISSLRIDIRQLRAGYVPRDGPSPAGYRAE